MMYTHTPKMSHTQTWHMWKDIPFPDPLFLDIHIKFPACECHFSRRSHSNGTQSWWFRHFQLILPNPSKYLTIHLTIKTDPIPKKMERILWYYRGSTSWKTNPIFQVQFLRFRKGKYPTIHPQPWRHPSLSHGLQFFGSFGIGTFQLCRGLSSSTFKTYQGKLHAPLKANTSYPLNRPPPPRNSQSPPGLWHF